MRPWPQSRSPENPAAGDRGLPEKLLVSPEEAAELLSLSRTRVYELIRRREIPSIRLGRVRRISLVALRIYVERLEAEQ